MLTLDQSKDGLRRLKEAGTKKVNFAGGEPLLREYQKYLGPLIQFAKEDLMFESVSIVSNGSELDPKWFKMYGKYIDVLAISCDSFNEDVNVEIGRASGKRGRQREYLRRAKDVCEENGIKFKINTVVNSLNFNEDMREHIKELNPSRWKCFQVLVLTGENKGETALRAAEKFAITDKQFSQFKSRHSEIPAFVPEGNTEMQNSYLILDEKMRFLDCSMGGKTPTASILEVGVEKALTESGYDPEMFLHRGGLYDWARAKENNVDLEDMA